MPAVWRPLVCAKRTGSHPRRKVVLQLPDLDHTKSSLPHQQLELHSDTGAFQAIIYCTLLVRSRMNPIWKSGGNVGGGELNKLQSVGLGCVHTTEGRDEMKTHHTVLGARQQSRAPQNLHLATKRDTAQGQPT